MHIRARARLRHLLFRQTKTKTRRQQTQSRGLISPVSTPAAAHTKRLLSAHLACPSALAGLSAQKCVFRAHALKLSTLMS